MAGAFSFEFPLVKNCPSTKLKKWIPIFLEIHNWNQIFIFFNGQFLTKRNSKGKWCEC
jgi:hypothetical protein